MTGKIQVIVPDNKVQTDLQRYQQRALDLGATQSVIITSDKVLVDERVRAKCAIPKCPMYSTNANCPPYVPELDFVRRMVNAYHYAIFTLTGTPPEAMAGSTAEDVRERQRLRRKNHEMISRLEAEAFHDGYYLALGLADGPCKSLFCPELPCAALNNGEGCRFPLKARPAMESLGINAYMMAAEAGWDMYPIGRKTNPSDVGQGTILGLVFIY